MTHMSCIRLPLELWCLTMTMVWLSRIAFLLRIGAVSDELWIVYLMSTSRVVMHSFLARLSLSLHVIGPQNYTRYALAIAPSVQELRTKSNVHGIFVHRLVFAVRYARFHELMEKREYQEAASDLIAIFSENVAPTSWWAVVLYDSVPLLRYGELPFFSPSGPL
jgi:hypothetical protein